MRTSIAFALFALLAAGCGNAEPTKTEPTAEKPAAASAAPPSASAEAAAPSAAPSASDSAEHSAGHDHGAASAAPEAEEPASAFHGEKVELPDTDGKGSGYLALPKGDAKSKHPAIVVIQEWWGMNGWVKHQADRFAEQGYVALAVDLYRGHVAKDQGEAHELMRGLPEDRAVKDLEGGFKLLEKRADVEPNKIGSVGWCMGGGYSLALALHEPKLKAVVVNYGKLVTDKAELKKLHASLLGNFGGKDRGISPEDVKAFEASLKAEKKSADVKIYENDGHYAFMNPANKEGYDEKSAKDAWERIDGFFMKELK